MSRSKQRRILIGCECSARIREAFSKIGWDAWSCDIKPTEIPGQHRQCNVLEVIDDNWDIGIFNPECRFLCFSGERWMKEKQGRLLQRIEAFQFFKRLYYCKIPFVAVENSHSVFLEQNFRKPDQKIHPYHFGEPFKKTTCLWLRNLPPLTHTNILDESKRYPFAWLMSPGKNRSTDRARTFQGIANAMAEQWTNYFINHKEGTL